MDASFCLLSEAKCILLSGDRKKDPPLADLILGNNIPIFFTTTVFPTAMVLIDVNMYISREKVIHSRRTSHTTKTIYFKSGRIG